jgi:hypothetical protein
MATNKSNKWDEIEAVHPNSSAQWDVQGGQEWVGNRSGPRLYFNKEGLHAYVGGTSEELVESWECAIWRSEQQKWYIRRPREVEMNGDKVHG